VLIHVPNAKDAIPALRKCLRDDDQQVRHNAAIALYGISGDASEAVAVLRSNLRSSLVGSDSRDEFDACAALLPLKNIGPAAKSARPSLILALGNSSPRVRAMAAEALEAINDNDELVKLALLRASNDFDPAVQLAANAALQSLFGIVQDARTMRPATAKDIATTIHTFPDETVVAWAQVGLRAFVISINTNTGNVTFWDGVVNGESQEAQTSAHGVPESDRADRESLIAIAIEQIHDGDNMEKVAERALDQLKSGSYAVRRFGEISPQPIPVTQ
jgi:hypothetical protein